MFIFSVTKRLKYNFIKSCDTRLLASITKLAFLKKKKNFWGIYLTEIWYVYNFFPLDID